MDELALWLYLGGAMAGIGVGALSWTVTLLRWPGALALGAALFAVGEGGFMVVAGIEHCIASSNGACVATRSLLWVSALGMVTLVGGGAALAALWPGMAARPVRLLAGAAALLTLAAVAGFATSIVAPASLLTPAVFGWLALRRPRLRYDA